MNQQAQKNLELRMKVVADTAEATKSVMALADAAAKAQAAASGRPAAGAGGASSGYTPPPGFGAPGGSRGPAAPGPGAMGAVAAFDRPIPVIIVGPRPLLVANDQNRAGGTGTGGGGGSGGGGGEDKGKKDKEARDLLTSLRNLGLGGVAGRYEQIKGFGEAVPGMFGMKLGGMGAAALKGVAGAGALGLSALETAGKAADIFGDDYLTGAEMGRRAFKEFVPFGETIQGSIDSLSGRKRGMEKANTDAAMANADMNARVQMMGTDLSLNAEQAGRVARARLTAGSAPILEGRMDRSTAAGELAFRDRQRMLPIERESAKAEREAAVAAAQRTAAAQELGKVEARMAELRKQRTEAEKKLLLSDNQSGPNRLRVLNDAKRIENEIQSTGDLQKTARTNLAAADQASAQARATAGMGQVQKLQAEAGILEDKAGRSAQAAQTLGGMDRFQRADAVRALRLLKQFGPDRVSQEDIAMARSIAPQTVAKILEAAGAASSEFQDLRGEAPEEIAGTPEALREQAQGKRDAAIEKQKSVETDLARSAAAAGADVGRYLNTVIRQLADSIKKEVTVDKILGRTSTS